MSFTAGGMPIYATYRHRVAASTGPAALLIAGSGVPDRNGDSPGAPEGSLRLLANQLAIDGVATLRYDKLGSGRTGLGRFASDLASIRVSTYSTEAAAALRFLAARPRSDPTQLSVFGHSEGGLYALLLATGQAGQVPPISRLGLIEPLSRRYLDAIDDQLDRRYDDAVRSGSVTAADAKTARQQLMSATSAVRAGHAPGTFPAAAAAFFGSTNLGYTADIDRLDPATLGARLPASMSVLLTCSTNDTQVPCTDVDHLDNGLKKGHASVDFARLTSMDHALKPDTTADSTNDNAALPMAPGLARAISQFVG